ncbi:MAG: hypothetical protein U0487_01860 [Patescibacteria group bacterium]
MTAIRRGPLTVITGPMGSGKSLALIRELELLRIRGRTFTVVKPKDDSRDGASVKSRMLVKPIEAVYIEEPADLAKSLKGSSVLAIDETQFLPRAALAEIITLLNKGTAVIACGLDTDVAGRPFGIMPELLAMADEATKIKAVCDQCKLLNATRTQIIIEPRGTHEPQRAYEQRLRPLRDFLDGKTNALIGNIGMYQPRCPQHHSLPDLPPPSDH